MKRVIKTETYSVFVDTCNNNRDILLGIKLDDQGMNIVLSPKEARKIAIELLKLSEILEDLSNETQ